MVSGRSFGVGWAALAVFACGPNDPVRPPPGTGGAPTVTGLSRVAAGGWHSCAIQAPGSAAGPELNFEPGTLLCWGRNDRGQAGSEELEPRMAPTSVLGHLSFVRVAAGEFFTCGITGEGALLCWGALPGDEYDAAPANPREAAPGVRFTHLTAGRTHACGVAENRSVWCWGDNAHGQLGDGTTTSRSEAARVTGVTADAVEAGGAHSCSVGIGSPAFCWGDNRAGQLGTGGPARRSLVPVAVAPAAAFSTINAGGSHTCALLGGVFNGGKRGVCWGSNHYGQLGIGEAPDGLSVPKEVDDNLAFRVLTAAWKHTCGLVHNLEFATSFAPNNIAYCWGDNRGGQVGTGLPISIVANPDSLEVSLGWESIAGGIDHSCGLSGGGAFCWGSNQFGQLGRSEPSESRVPLQVLPPAG